MATLFERLIGLDLPPGDVPAEEEKIAIHAFTGAFNEYQRGKITGAQIGAMFSLDTAQTAEAVALKDLLVAAPQKIEFMRVFKDWLYLGETRTDPQYLVRANLVQRLEDEVTDQGGTLP